MSGNPIGEPWPMRYDKARRRPSSSGAAERSAPAMEEVEAQSPSDEVRTILEEARMILPGTEVLFGFQLIVVFNQRFQERLSLVEQYLHLGATALVVVATGLLIAPAAYHRRAEPELASRRFVALSTRLLSWSTIPLMLAVCADFYLVATLVTGRWWISLMLALGLLAILVELWVLLPRRGSRAGN